MRDPAFMAWLWLGLWLGSPMVLGLMIGVML